MVWSELGRDGSDVDGSVGDWSVRDALVKNRSVAKKVAADPPFFNWFEISKFDQNLKHIYNSSICKEYKVKNTSQNTSQVKSEYKSI